MQRRRGVQHGMRTSGEGDRWLARLRGALRTMLSEPTLLPAPCEGLGALRDAVLRSLSMVPLFSMAILPLSPLDLLRLTLLSITLPLGDVCAPAAPAAVLPGLSIMGDNIGVARLPSPWLPSEVPRVRGGTVGLKLLGAPAALRVLSWAPREPAKLKRRESWGVSSRLRSTAGSVGCAKGGSEEQAACIPFVKTSMVSVRASPCTRFLAPMLCTAGPEYTPPNVHTHSSPTTL